MRLGWGGISLLPFAAFVSAQGQLGGSQASCNSSQPAVYIGCYDVSNSVLSPYGSTAGNYFYPFQISPYPNNYESSSGNYTDLNSYVAVGNPIGSPLGFADYNFTDGNGPFRDSFLYNSMTPANCTIACRGHGYAFSALISKGDCICGSFPPIAPSSRFSYTDGGPNNQLLDVGDNQMCRSASGCA